ncbi:Fe-regulated protein [Penicillium canescens]|uniref:Fe-regulated protein n=1 Tax=Penicillium canescens TaxID=5083 RepID=A0AAD6IQ98_PENCN|nr:Fe-regulated protein [Penicillium canescens]KAJ6033193.1 Fe-regulated protein [Penicillium canescens]KAJ6057618.1 Fe-regulated protein [Penicillium canescens]KAJ6058932.1 Fe-regulated protein [Penicillium canescens]
MAPEYIRIFTNFAPVIFESTITIASQQIRALHHRLTYHASPDTRNVVVIGGSFAGLQLAKRLSQTLPSGFRVVLVEKNSHFNFTFNFPRYSVVGEERKAFIPYNDAFRRAPEGSWVLLRDTVTHVTDGEILLQSGQKLPFDYLAIATGLQQPLPAKMLSPHKDEACADLRSLRVKIQRAARIAIVGGGAVGVQLAADIKSAFPTKEVALIHSRERVLNSFGKRLSDFVEAKLDEMGIKVMLKERVHIPSMTRGAGAVYGGIQQNVALIFQDGSETEFDLIIPCVGATPNTEFLSSFIPSNFSRTTGRILVRRTLQLAGDAHSNTFALGDVAETEGPKMGRSAMAQAELVCENILALIKGTTLRRYEPKAIDGMLKLTLGLEHIVIYVKDGKGADIMVPVKSSNLDLEVAQAWWYLNGDMKAEIVN